MKGGALRGLGESGLGSGNSMCKGPEPLLQMRNCSAFPLLWCFSSTRWGSPLGALLWAPTLAQNGAQKTAPVSTVTTLISSFFVSMKTMKAVGPAAQQWLWVFPSKLGKAAA